MANETQTVQTEEIKRVEIHLQGDLREFVERRKEEDGIPYAQTIKKALNNLKDEEDRAKAS
jgi:LDH2 family malate/lactate/ureidoglycolate dehydrogenase